MKETTVTLARMIVVAGLLTLLATSPAAANLRDSKGNFVFGGKHYKSRSLAKPTLGINIMFRGGSPATTGRVAFHLAHGYGQWGKRTSFVCGGPRYVPYPSPDRRNNAWAAPTMHGTITFPNPIPGHKPAESYAMSRSIMIRYMSTGPGVDHYVDPHYVKHPGARGITAGKPNDRIIGRVSNAHR